MKHTWSAIKNYLAKEDDPIFVSTVTDLWNGTALSFEETSVLNEHLACN